MEKKPESDTRQMVMVHPDVFFDPVQRPGAIGKVVGYCPEDKTATIEFRDGKKAGYYAGYLIALYPRKMIIHTRITYHKYLSQYERKIILCVVRLAIERLYASGLRLAMRSKCTRFCCTTAYKNLVHPQDKLGNGATEL